MKAKVSLFYPLLLIAIISAVSFPGKADTTTPEIQKKESFDDTLQAKSKTLLTEIKDLTRQSTFMRSKIKDVPEVDRPLLIKLILSTEITLRKKLDQLIEIEQQQAEKKVTNETLIQKIQTICTEQSKIIQGEIKSLNTLITKLREQDAAEGSLQLSIERVDQEINRLLIEWQKNIARKKILGIDTLYDIEQLTQTIQLRAIVQAGRIQILLDNIKLLNTHMENATEEELLAINQKLRTLDIKKQAAATNLEAMVALMKTLGMETTSFGKVLVVATGEILNKNVNTEAVLGLFQIATNNAMRWLKDNLPLIIFRLVSFILIILAFKVLASILRRLIDRATSSSPLESSQLLKNFMGSIISKTVMLIGIIIALSQLGIEIGPLLAGMGVMGFVVGFALQDALSNFASGLMILIYRPFDTGDFVEVAGINGTVKEMNLVSTTLLTVDRKRMIIPNTKIWGDIITNVTAEDLRRIDLVFAIGYSDDMGHAERVLKTIIDQHELILKEPEPVIKLHTLGESSVNFIVRPWVKMQNYWPVYWDITRQVKEKFDQEGISIPYPQRDIHIIPAEQTELKT